MSGSHVAPSSHQSNKNSNSGGSGWKVAVLVIVLLIAIAALCFLLWQLFGESIMGMIGGDSSGGTANVAPGIFTQVGAEYGNGKNVSGNLTVNQGTQRPAEIPADAQNVVLLDITWTGSKEQTEPVYLTVSDPSFTDGDGLSVYEYDTPQAAWELVGTYRIQDNAVTFQADEMTAFAFQVISSTPVIEASPIPAATPEPTPTPVPTPEPTPVPATVMDYGSYPTVQSGVYALTDEMEDDGVYVVALVQDLPQQTQAPEEEADSDSEQSSDSGSEAGGVDFTYVNAPDATVAPDAGTDAAAAAPATEAPKAVVLMNRGGDALGAVEMSMVQADDGTWCLVGPITEGMLWTANRDYYSGDYRYSLGNNERYLNTDDAFANIILTDNSVRTRWLPQQATLADGSTIDTLDYRDTDRYYVSALGNVVEALSDQLFPAGEVPAEPNPQAAQVTYIGTTVPPTDQTLYRETLRFSVTTDQTLAQRLVLFKLDSTKTLPATAQALTTPTAQITVPPIDAFTDLSMLDIRDGDTLLQLGVDYTVAAKVYNNSTVAVVISFMGKYSGQIVRTYAGTSFRADANQPTPSPEPSPTPAPVTNYTGGGGGGGGGGWVPPETTNNDPASATDTTTYDDPTDS